MAGFLRRFAIGRPEFVLLVAGALFFVSVSAFIFVADEMSENEYQHQEEILLRSLRTPQDAAQPIGPKWVETWSLELTSLGSGPVMALMVLLVTGYFVVARQYGSAVLVFVVSGSGAVVADILKHLYDRARPSVVPHLAEVSSGSFPSGHSMASSMIYLTLGAVLAQATPSWRERIYLLSVAFGLSLLVGVTRVYLGVHYPSDVIAGWAAGMAWALLCWMVFYGLKQRHLLR